MIKLYASDMEYISILRPLVTLKKTLNSAFFKFIIQFSFDIYYHIDKTLDNFK